MKKLLFALLIGISQIAYSQFIPPTTLAINYSHLGLGFLVDLDIDNDLDIVQSDDGSTSIRVFWNVAGSFSIQTHANAQALQGKSYAAGDLDGDGDIDLACATGWLENEGFNFTTSHDYSPADATGGQIVCEDVNGDSHLDLLLAIGNNPLGGPDDTYHFYSLLNDGLGNFTAANSPAEEVKILWLVDINQDGTKDIVTQQPYPYELRCSYGNGDGTFQSYVVLFPSFNASASGFADLNGDMIQDLFAVSGYSLKIYYGIPTGGLAPEIVQVLNTNFTYWYDCDNNLTTDYDGDGDIDLMLRPERGLHWLENTTSGFEEHGNVLTRPDNAATFIWIDLNNDGKMDGVETSTSLITALQYDDGILYTEQMLSATGTHCGHSFQIIDLNQDGTNDILSRGDIGWVGFANDGFGTYSKQLMGLTNMQLNLGVSYFDFNRDGQQDLLTGFYNEGANCSIREDDLHFKPMENVLPSLGGNLMCWAYLELDVNHDNDQDLVVLTNSNVGRRVKWFDYDETDGWIAQSDIANLGISGTGNYWIDGLQKGDFNGDDIQDMAVVSLNDVYMLLGDGMGNYETIQVYVSPDLNGNVKVSEKAVFDINGDGLDDLIFLDLNFDNSQNKIKYITYNGSSYDVVQAATYSNTTQINTYCIGDFDGDADNDIIYRNTNALKMISNNGFGIFAAAVSLNFNSLAGLEQISAAKMDNDNMPDLVLSGMNNNGLTAWLQVAYNNLDSPFQIQFHVFIDSNGDGIQNNGEAPMMNQQIYLGEEWGYIYTDEMGQFHFYGNAGTTTASINPNPDLWNFITPSSQSVDLTILNPTAEIFFAIQPNGVQPSVYPALATSGDVCGSEYVHWLSVTNTGNTLASGSITYTLDNQFTFSSALPAPDAIVGNTLTWNFTSLYYNEIFQVELLALSPDVNSIGQEAAHTLVAELVDDLNNVVFTDQLESTYTIQCSYDPNDLQEQLGQTEAGYILTDGELQYLVRFQNIGNANAEYVRIEDMLSEKLDWSTLQVVGTSHDYELTINSFGKAIFVFDDIALPPTTTDEVGSHGFVSFRVKPISGLLAGETIENTASIFFDFNPAVVTNTEINTIYDCADLQQATTSATEVCVGDEIAFGNDAVWLENLSWTFEGNEVGNGSYSHTTNASGTMMMSASNALCSYEESFEITALVATSSFTQNGNLLSANASTTYQWYLNGNEIANATSQTFEITQTGNYSIMITDANGCNATSDAQLVTYTGIEEISASQISVYPNPASGFVTITISNDLIGNEIVITDMLGKVVMNIGCAKTLNTQVDCSLLAKGIYAVVVGGSSMNLVVE